MVVSNYILQLYFHTYFHPWGPPGALFARSCQLILNYIARCPWTLIIHTPMVSQTYVYYKWKKKKKTLMNYHIHDSIERVVETPWAGSRQWGETFIRSPQGSYEYQFAWLPLQLIQRMRAPSVCFAAIRYCDHAQHAVGMKNRCGEGRFFRALGDNFEQSFHPFIFQQWNKG